MTVMTFLCTSSNGIPLILQLAILSLPLPTSPLSCLMPCLLVEPYGSRKPLRLTGNLNSRLHFNFFILDKLGQARTCALCCKVTSFISSCMCSLPDQGGHFSLLSFPPSAMQHVTTGQIKKFACVCRHFTFYFHLLNYYIMTPVNYSSN